MAKETLDASEKDASNRTVQDTTEKEVAKDMLDTDARNFMAKDPEKGTKTS